MSEEKLNLYQKLAKIRKLTEVIQKNKKGFGYTYVTEDEILARVTAGMEKYGVSLIPKMVAGTTEVTPIHYIKRDSKPDKAGNLMVTEKSVDEYLITGQIEWHWVNDENPAETIMIPWMLIGQQSDASQTFGSAWTYASRYFLLKYFNVATSDDDPDNYKTKKAEASQQEEKAIVEATIETIQTLIEKNITPENRKTLGESLTKSKLIMENGKASANYHLVEDKETALKVLEIVKTVFSAKAPTSKAKIEKEDVE